MEETLAEMKLNSQLLKTPYTYFGAKGQVVDMVWRRLGDVTTYCEPFFGSGAVLLKRPQSHKKRREIINDRNHFIANFWRSIKAEPDKVAEFANVLIAENELHSRHVWLSQFVSEKSDFAKRLYNDPDYYDVKIAGWWVWGISCWIGSGWCAKESDPYEIMPHMTGVQGINGGKIWENIPDVFTRRGVNGGKIEETLPHVSSRQGINKIDEKRPEIFHTKGINSGIAEKMTRIGHAGITSMSNVNETRPELKSTKGINVTNQVPKMERNGIVSKENFTKEWLETLSQRIRNLFICCGSWERVCSSNTTTTALGPCGVFLDPPYAHDLVRLQALINGEEAESSGVENRCKGIYLNDDKDNDIDKLCADVNAWCIENGKNKDMRIALCGYLGEHENLVKDHGWQEVQGKANGGGGYGNQRKDGTVNENKLKERIWFSPYCLPEKGVLKNVYH